MRTDVRKPLSLALLSSSMTQLLSSTLKKELRGSGWDVSIWEAGFDQYRQEITNPDSALYRASPELAVLYLEGDDLFGDCLREPFLLDRAARRERALAVAAETEHLVDVMQTRSPNLVIVLNTIFLPPTHALTGLEYNSRWGLSDLAAHYNLELARIVCERENVLCHDVASLAAQIGYSRWYDPRLWYLARTRISSDGTKHVARSLAALVRAWKGETKKCVVLDLDNTLWGGIVGEDGIDGIVLGSEGQGLAYAEFQQELANLERKGVLLAICSKNNEDDAMEVLRSHPSMRLREGHFAAIRINWEDKATNLQALAHAMNLGLDSLVFIDDNPFERELIRSTFPEVLVPDWPSDVSDYKTALLELGAEHLLRIALTQEDAERTAMYHSEVRRQAFASSTGSLEDYLRSLEMHVELGFADKVSIPRIAQLTQKTNQFNLTTRRYTEAEIRDLARSSEAMVLWLRLRDRFSDSGLVGVLILRQAGRKTWIIDTFLLSCRALGRRVEEAFLGYACQVLLDRGAHGLIGEYRSTQKNLVVANLYKELGFTGLEEDQEIAKWRLSLLSNVVAIPDWISVEMKTESLHA
ncbi:MAG: HAD-IIIC family phosphatase [Bryobacteraceae bacterium]